MGRAKRADTRKARQIKGMQDAAGANERYDREGNPLTVDQGIRHSYYQAKMPGSYETTPGRMGRRFEEFCVKQDSTLNYLAQLRRAAVFLDKRLQALEQALSRDTAWAVLDSHEIYRRMVVWDNLGKRRIRVMDAWLEWDKVNSLYVVWIVGPEVQADGRQIGKRVYEVLYSAEIARDSDRTEMERKTKTGRSRFAPERH